MFVWWVCHRLQFYLLSVTVWYSSYRRFHFISFLASSQYNFSIAIRHPAVSSSGLTSFEWNSTEVAFPFYFLFTYSDVAVEPLWVCVTPAMKMVKGSIKRPEKELYGVSSVRRRTRRYWVEYWIHSLSHAYLKLKVAGQCEQMVRVHCLRSHFSHFYFHFVDLFRFFQRCLYSISHAGSRMQTKYCYLPCQWIASEFAAQIKSPNCTLVDESIDRLLKWSTASILLFWEFDQFCSRSSRWTMTIKSTIYVQ